MKKFTLGFLFLSLVILLTAIPAGPYPITKTLPDGTTLDIMLRGDEHVHWAQTLDGFTLIEESGYYFYADKQGDGDLFSSGIRAHNVGMRTSSETSFIANHKTDLRYSRAQIYEALEAFPKQEYNLRSRNFPTTGTQNMLLILVNYSDTSTLYSQTNFNNYMNQTNFNSTGSFKDYYLEVSHNQLTMNTTVTAWVSVSGTHDYYGPESRWQLLAYQAIQAADAAGIDFSQFDNNNDGTVDGIAIIHQGPGQEATGDTSDVWSHSSSLSWSYTSTQRTFDGVLVNEYTMQPELYGSGTTMTSIGVMCHEFGHNLGAPDYYDTDYEVSGQYDGTGDWDLMAGGSWNNNGRTPAHHNPYTKWIYYGWMTPTLLTAASSPTLNNVVDDNTDFYYYTTTTSGEFFMIENRQQTGFDAALSGHGLIIYHVDSNYISSHYSSNDINATSHQGFYPKAAGGTINASSCPFPGTLNRTSFTDTTTPDSKSWAGANTGKPITNIAENSGVISLDFMGGSYVSVEITAPDDGSNHFIGDTINVTANVSTTVGAIAYATIQVKDSSDNVVYTFQDNASPYSFNWDTTTVSQDIYTITVTGYDNTGHTNSDMISIAVNDAGSVLSESFEGGIIPSGWTEQIVSGSVNWAIASGNGSTHPSNAQDGTYNLLLKDSDSAADETKIITPYLNFGSYTYNPQLKFYLYMEYWPNDQDEMKVYYRNSVDGAWTQLAYYFSNVSSWTQYTINLPNPNSTYQIAFEGNAKYGYGVCLDNIRVIGQIPLPLAAISPSPITTATDVSITTDLTWLPDPASSQINGYAVFFNSFTPPTSYVDNGLSTTYSPVLDYSTTYYWQILPYNTSGAAASCPIWSFTTSAPPSPDAATNPGPADTATDIEPTVNLTWNAPVSGITPEAYKVYLDTDPNPTTQVMDADAMTFNPTLNYGTTYYWKVVPYTNDAKSSRGEATGCPIWSFTTVDYVPEDNSSGGSVAPEDPASIPEGTTVTAADPVITPTIPDGQQNLEDIVITVTSPTPVVLTVTINFTGTAQYVYHVEGAANIADGLLNWGEGTVSFDFSFSGAAKGSDTFVVTGEEPILPVELSLFEAAMVSKDDVEIHWVTESETETGYYNILRDTGADVAFALNITTNNPVQSVPSSTHNEYSYYDREFESGETYNYWLEAVAINGTTKLFGPVTVTCAFEENPDVTPEVLVTSLDNVYPNPFNPNLGIKFSLAGEQHVLISIYNARGQHITDICSETLLEGVYTRSWNGHDTNGKIAQSGVYFVRMQSGSSVFVKKAILLK